MFSILILALGLLSLVAAAPAPSQTLDRRLHPILPTARPVHGDSPTVELEHATVIGSRRHGIESFRGIPFAQPPVGKLRLQRPQPITEHLGTVVANGLLPASCPQQVTSVNPNNTVRQDAIQEILNSGAVQTLLNIQEDCLTVTVQKPEDAKPGDKLPVLFSLFFGGFGFGSIAIYDSSKLMRASIEQGKPFVYVAVNYRLGAFGWLAGKEVLEAGLANLGHHDQILGLQWVADNIEAFGGDPEKVTLFGTSAGSISIWNLLSAYDGELSYKGKPLFRAGIMDSGSVIPLDPVGAPKAQAIFDTVTAAANCSSAADKLECLRGLEYEEFLTASTSTPGLFNYESVALSYIPRPDGTLLTDSGDNLAAAGKFAKVPFIIGDQEDEGTLFSLVQQNITTTDDIVEYFKTFYFLSASDQQIRDFVSLYPEDQAAGSPYNTGERNNIYPQYKRLASIIGDFTFTMVRRLLLTASAIVHPDVRIYSYIGSYTYGTPILGSFHVGDVIPVYGLLPGFSTRTIQRYYINFIHSTDPNSDLGDENIEWPQWSKEQKVINFRKNTNEIWTDDFRKESSNFLAANRASFHF